MIFEMLKSKNKTIELFNGGGSGSLVEAATEPWLTEVSPSLCELCWWTKRYQILISRCLFCVGHCWIFILARSTFWLLCQQSKWGCNLLCIACHSSTAEWYLCLSKWWLHCKVCNRFHVHLKRKFDHLWNSCSLKFF